MSHHRRHWNEKGHDIDNTEESATTKEFRTKARKISSRSITRSSNAQFLYSENASPAHQPLNFEQLLITNSTFDGKWIL